MFCIHHPRRRYSRGSVRSPPSKHARITTTLNSWHWGVFSGRDSHFRVLKYQFIKVFHADEKDSRVLTVIRDRAVAEADIDKALSRILLQRFRVGPMSCMLTQSTICGPQICRQ